MFRAALLLLIGLGAAGVARAEPPGPGGVLDAATAATAAELLPPELIARYQAGEYRNTIAAWTTAPAFAPAFVEATARHQGALAVSERGTILQGRDGPRAIGLYGLPFAIDPGDPQAGVKAIWNAYYALWRVGSTEDVLALDWLSRGGLERQAVMETRTLYYEGVPSGLASRENPLDLAAQQSAVVTSPADLNGTASLVWRFRDPDKQDEAWTYVPALRRVRKISPTNRSDGFLGSDLSQDDGAFFDGKPEAFEWKLLGARDGYVLADPASLTGGVKRNALPNGGYADEWPPGQTVVGYQDKSWTGVAWAPVAPVLVRRKLWVVEARPRDPYYLFRRIEIALDQETFQGVWSRKFDAQGTLLRSLQFLVYGAEPTPDGEAMPASSMGYLAAVNVKANRATVTGTAPPGPSRHYRRVPLDPALFSLERLGAGK
ncbi:MAG TPA: DUF1329 domain-containing protein [Candidatus Limnocylindria bacterium]|nr:DUF1329 domain-containing protein [Candidatus Limnocylindria bacterium]